MPGFTDGWTLAPDLVPYADSIDKMLRAYQVTSDGRVGSRIEDTSRLAVSCLDVRCDLVSADAGKWAQVDGLALVLARKHNADAVWLERVALEDPKYSATLQQVAVIAAEEDAELRAGFWSELRSRIESKPTVRLPDAFPGFDPRTQQTVEVPAGTYERVAIREGEFRLSDGAPFYVVIRLPSGAVVGVSPSTLGGVASPIAGESPQPGSSPPVSAAQLREAFAATPEYLRRHIPAGVWLTDEQIHYVEPDEMGASHVLKRVPRGSAEVAEVKGNDATRDTFVTGMSTPGLRLGADILVLKTMLGTGTEYHEAVHQRSHDMFRKALGTDLNEGVTEYFTRVVVAGRLARVDSPYEPQLASANALIETQAVTEAELAAAYFAGHLAPVFAGFDLVTRGTLSLQAFVERQQADTAHIAQELLRGALAG